MPEWKGLRSFTGTAQKSILSGFQTSAQQEDQTENEMERRQNERDVQTAVEREDAQTRPAKEQAAKEVESIPYSQLQTAIENNIQEQQDIEGAQSIMAQFQVNQNNTEPVTDVNGAGQVPTGSSMASSAGQQVANATVLRKDRDLDPNILNAMMPAKGTQLQAERDKAQLGVLKMLRANVKEPSTKRKDRRGDLAEDLLRKDIEDRENFAGGNILVGHFYDIFRSRNNHINQAISLYQQSIADYGQEVDLYKAKLKYNEELYKQYMAGKEAYFENAKQEAMLAKNFRDYSIAVDYSAQGVGAKFNEMEKAKYEAAQKRGEELLKNFREGKSIGTLPAQNLIEMLVNDADTGSILLADMGNLLGQLTANDDNFSFATHDLTQRLANKNFNNAALDVIKVVANSDTLKQRIRTINAANKAGLGKGEWVFWKAKFDPQMIAEVCDALDYFDGYNELSKQYQTQLARKNITEAGQYADANRWIAESGIVNEEQWNASTSQNLLATSQQADYRREECMKIIRSSESSPEDKFNAYLAMGTSPEHIPDDVTMGALIAMPIEQMSMPLNQLAARQALYQGKQLALPLFTTDNAFNKFSKEFLLDHLKTIIDMSDESTAKMIKKNLKMGAAEDVIKVFGNVEDRELQERVLQLKHSPEYRMAVLNSVRDSLMNATIMETLPNGQKKKVETNGNATKVMLDMYVQTQMKNLLMQSALGGTNLNNPAGMVYIKNELGKMLKKDSANNLFFAVTKINVNDRVDRYVEQHWEDVSNKVNAELEKMAEQAAYRQQAMQANLKEQQKFNRMISKTAAGL